MESGWIQDTFQKNDLFLDRARSTYTKNCGVDKADLIEHPVDVYFKKIDGTNLLYRVILVIGNAKEKTVRIGDGVVKRSGMSFEMSSAAFAEWEKYEGGVGEFEKFKGEGEVLVAKFEKPILNKYLLIKKENCSVVYQLDSSGEVKKVANYNF